MHPLELLPAAFERCGIFPVNEEMVTSRLPSTDNTKEIAQHVDQSLLKALKVRRYGDGQRKKDRVCRGKKIPAGQSYTALVSSSSSEEEKADSTGTETTSMEDTISEESEDMEQAASKRKKVQRSKIVDSRKNRNTLMVSSSSEESGEEIDKEQAASKKKKVQKSKKTGGEDMEKEDKNNENRDQDLPENMEPCSSWNCGSLVVADYDGDALVAEIIKNQDHLPKQYLRLSYTTHRVKGENIFSWPDRKDIFITEKEDIILHNVKVEPLNSRGHFCLSKDDHKKVKKLMMVVVYPIPYFLYFELAI